ncbi:MAG: sigma-54-dependent Fis family transcriptional regulator [Acidobacteria bacterium]|nr:sigma-54-dependent Fis family transcriptional regulator [Acidobacteriota bacterium]
MSRDAILIVDDEEGVQTSLQGILEDVGLEAQGVGTGEEGLALMTRKDFAVVLLDIWLPGMDGLQVLEKIREMAPATMVVMISGHGSIETAVRATKLGAFDFIEKPLSLEKTLVVVKNALHQQHLREENRRLRAQVEQKYVMIGDSVPMQALRQQIDFAAPTNGRILICGENGTGKELVAHLLHLGSERQDRPFVEMNCAAIPEELIESELFGHVRGSFTGASEDKEGKFSQADGGTLFLDEVGDMSPKTQAKVLRVLEEQSFTPVGGKAALKVDVRVIASTNKNLEREIEIGNFREDLYYRLNVIPFQLPPLRERREDILVLARYFLEDFAQKYGRTPPVFTRKAMDILETYHWPGNVRELRNVMERFIIMNPQQRIDVFDIPEAILRRTVFVAPEEGGADSLQQARERFERDFILQKLLEHRGNISRSAQSLRIERSHLYRKMKQLGIPYSGRETVEEE